MLTIAINNEEDWRTPLIEYLKYRKFPDDTRHKTEVRQRSSRFILYKDTLYRRSFEGTYQHCLSGEEALEAMTEAHSRVCGAHQSGPKLHFRIKRMGYYWSTMVKDCLEYAKKCESCQLQANFIHQPPKYLHPTVASWSFDAWGLDVVGPINPKSSVGHIYILAATDYFSKWAKVVPLKEVKKETVVDFIRINIIFRYGVPRYIITDNGKSFYNKAATQATPYFLVYGVEAVLLLESQISSLRIAIQEGLTVEDNARLRLEELEALDEKRLEAQQQLQCYQARMSKAFNKKV
ncbi:UNVERIFIED_CONTAM: hypothetical protein Slati_0477000 [Sesamum latifolium]|uniref:Integrase catalytic domain-containing protein n=1 Tax=Sesamum latifolium TaxID=2727402 RepID=A0AAW2XY73_9LAMI